MKCDFHSQHKRFLQRERGRERGTTGGEVECVGSQACGLTYRMIVVNIHAAGHERSHTHTHTHT